MRGVVEYGSDGALAGADASEPCVCDRMQGTVNTLIDNCAFVRVDGNALMLSGYNRNATVQHSNFEWIGNTAMAAWGYTHELHTSEGLPDGNGINGADGNQPRGTRIINNIVHEIGLYEKQSSCWFQAKSAQTLLEGKYVAWCGSHQLERGASKPLGSA